MSHSKDSSRGCAILGSREGCKALVYKSIACGGKEKSGCRSPRTLRSNQPGTRRTRILSVQGQVHSLCTKVPLNLGWIESLVQFPAATHNLQLMPLARPALTSLHWVHWRFMMAEQSAPVCWCPQPGAGGFLALMMRYKGTMCAPKPPAP